MKRILVTPAGRKRYLEILFNHLKNLKNEFYGLIPKTRMTFNTWKN